MALLLRMDRSFARKATKFVGRLALFLALIFMSLEMIRVRGWGGRIVESMAAAGGVTVGEFWAWIASVSVAAAFTLLVLGLMTSWLSRSRFLEEGEPEEPIDVAALTQRIRNFEEFQGEQASRRPQPIR